jgi:CheY-like chemotaxis protein
VEERILKGKRILAVDDEPDILSALEDQLREAGADLTMDQATTYQDAAQKLASVRYDAAILDIMGVRGFDLLKIAAEKRIPALMFTAHALTADSLKRSIELGARAFVPKERIDQVAPFLEDILTHPFLPGWKRVLERLKSTFDLRFGVDWHKSEAEFWEEFNEKLGSEKWIITR